MQPLRSIDPVIVFRNSQGDSARGTLTRLQRRSLEMELYTPNSVVRISEVLNELTIRSGLKTIYQGKAAVVGLVNTGLMSVVSVTLSDEWQDLQVMGLDKESVAQEALAFVDDWQKRFTIRHDYQVVVSEMRAYLSEASRWIDQADIASGLPRDASGRVSEDVFYGLATPLVEKGSEFLTRLEAVASQVDEPHAAVHRSFAQAAIHPLILQAPFVYRTFAKPLGYAGDYEMVNQILGDPRQGSSTYIQLVNLLFLKAGVAQAHRNRIDILCSKLDMLAKQAVAEQRSLRVLNIGCGPAAEIQRFIRNNPDFDKLEFVLVDFSSETLEYTRERLLEAQAGTGKSLRFTLQHESVNQLLKRTQRATVAPAEEQFDFVYCAGLFDYLTDKVCLRLVKYFASRLRPGGRILVTNVHSDNPQRYVMEHLLEWYLIYRDEQQMQSVLDGVAATSTLYTDETGVNIFGELALNVEHKVAAIASH
ncbi:SAM-dependent methyltransferase [Variovorax sp. HJSM1_2]|uniref:SAM-dependent methyltransferase n=1 Tax=Variovorax sp. HJSM1_2 TaxID=3366263 RepID=UPI003BC5B584